jgi:hypothetical protein
MPVTNRVISHSVNFHPTHNEMKHEILEPEDRRLRVLGRPLLMPQFICWRVDTSGRERQPPTCRWEVILAQKERRTLHHAVSSYFLADPSNRKLSSFWHLKLSLTAFQTGTTICFRIRNLGLWQLKYCSKYWVCRSSLFAVW